MEREFKSYSAYIFLVLVGAILPTCSTQATLKSTSQSTSPSNTIRLVGGSGPHNGRVEVYFNWIWANVCDSSWDYEESNVVCRQLGFIGAVNTFYTPKPWPQTPRGSLGKFECEGNETQWTDCSTASYSWLYCYYGVTANCIKDINYSYREGDVRLFGTSSEHTGSVEIYHNREWGTICDDGWNIADAEVVCRQLGFPGAALALDNGYYDQGNGYILLDDVACNGTEHYLRECKHPGWHQHNCGPGEEAGVRCHMPDVHYPRLVNGSKPSEGRVEIWDGKQWTKFCHYFDENYGAAICREVGFDDVDYVAFDGRYGHGYNPPSKLMYACLKEENSLLHCEISSRNVNYCETVVLGCKNILSFSEDNLSLSTVALCGIVVFTSIFLFISLICVYKQCNLRERCTRKISRADPNGQINDGASNISTHINEDAPPAYNDVVDSNV